MRAVRPGFLTANQQIHPIARPATYLDSLVRVPSDRRAQTSESRQFATTSSPEASSRCVRRESDGRRHRTRSNSFHPSFGTSTFPLAHAEAHLELTGCE